MADNSDAVDPVAGSQRGGGGNQRLMFESCRAALAQSLRSLGAGRSIVLDRHGRIIAGNKTAEQAKALGLRLRVITTDGHIWWPSSGGISI